MTYEADATKAVVIYKILRLNTLFKGLKLHRNRI